MFNLMIPTNGQTPSLLNDGFFSDFFSPSVTTRRAAWPAVDAHELKDKFVLKIDVPGVDEKDIRIEFNDGMLVIEGTRTEETEKKENEEENYVHIRERSQAQFRRTFTLGDRVDAEKIAATYKNGTLTVEVPKSERAIPRVIPIGEGKKS